MRQAKLCNALRQDNKRMLTSFFRLINQSSISFMWKTCSQGSTLTLSPTANSSRQIAHSAWVVYHGRWIREEPCSTLSNSSSPSLLTLKVKLLFRAGSVTSPAFEGVLLQGVPSAFSHLVPFQTRHGRFLTISSGARSRCAARDARMRCTRSVMRVRTEGRRRITMNVTIGLQNKVGLESQSQSGMIPCMTQWAMGLTSTTPMRSLQCSEVEIMS